MGRKTITYLLDYGIYVIFLTLFVLLSLTTPRFFTGSNLVNILLQISVIGVISIGMTFVIVAQGIDVSVGALVALSAGAGIGIIKIFSMPWWLGMTTMLVVGVVMGLINGVSVAYLGMPAFLVTLATMSVARGLVLVLSGGQSWFNLPAQFGVLTDTLGPIPYLLIVMALLYVIGYVVLHHSVYGRRVFAVGDNREAAANLGLNIKVIITSTFVVSGLFSGMAGVMQTARIGAFWASMGRGFEFSAIAAVVIGGTSLSGGVGGLGGTLVGAMTLGIINNALNLWGVPSTWQNVARGLIIFLAVMLDALRHKLPEQ